MMFHADLAEYSQNTLKLEAEQLLFSQTFCDLCVESAESA